MQTLQPRVSSGEFPFAFCLLPFAFCLIPRRLLASAAAWALATLIVLAGRGTAIAQAPAADADLARAEQHYQRGELLKAEPFFRAALPNARGADKRLCFERLLALYYRV